MNILRPIAVASVSLTLALAAACGGDDAASERTSASPATSPSAAAATIVPRTTVSQTPLAETPAGGEDDAAEVTGIVGAVNQATSTIEINQLSGADVTQIEVTPQTELRRARGGTTTLSSIRPSDRIVAEGAVDGQALIATRVTVQDVVPGSSPGG